ncbi:hypothetical protein JW824_13505 [bacterium]|nr:hypothetical protein [bacterium]
MRKPFVLLGIAIILMMGACTQQMKEIPITTSSEEARNLFLQGRENWENIEVTKAGQLFGQAIAKDSSFALAYCFRTFTGDELQIRADMEKAILLSDQVSEGERLFINYIQSSLDGDLPKVKENLDKLLTMFPEDKRVNMFMGWYFRAINDYKTAIAYFTKAAEIDKEFALAYNELGYTDILTEDLEAAENAFKEYIRLIPDKPNPYDSYAELLLKMGRYDESIVQYQKAYDTDNTFIASLRGLGNNYIFKDNFTKAREYYQLFFDKATLVSERLNALFLKALSFLYENKLNDAIKVFEELRLLAEKENQPVAIVNSCVNEGFLLTEMGKSAEGLKKYEEAIRMIDKVNLTERQKENLRVDSNGWLARGYALNNMLNQAKASAALYKQDVDLRNIPDEQDNLEFILALIDFKEAKYDAVIDRLSKMEPNPLYMFYQAQAYLKKGNKEEADRLFNKVANWNQNNIGLAVVWARTQKALGE